MKIDIYCASVTLAPEEPTQMSGCGIKLVATEGEDKYVRMMSFGLGSSCKLRSIGMMLRLALVAVIPKYRSCQTVIHCEAEDAYRLLCKVGRRYQYDYDLDILKDLRLIADTFKDLYVIFSGEAPPADVCSLAQQSAATQVNTDVSLL